VDGMDLNLPPIPDADGPVGRKPCWGLSTCSTSACIPLKKPSNTLAMKSPCLRANPHGRRSPQSLTQPTPVPNAPDQKRPGSGQTRQEGLVPHRVRGADSLPRPASGAVSNGYEEYVVQELLLEAKVTRYWRERIVVADGSSRLAPLPDGRAAGPALRPEPARFRPLPTQSVHVTQGKLLEQLHDWASTCSAGELSHLLTDNHEEFHQRRPRYSQPVCNRRIMSVWTIPGHATRQERLLHGAGQRVFCLFREQRQTSRLNFLKVLRGPATAYTINESPWPTGNGSSWPKRWWRRCRQVRATVRRRRPGKLVGGVGDHVGAAPAHRYEGALLGQVIAQGCRRTCRSQRWCRAVQPAGACGVRVPAERPWCG